MSEDRTVSGEGNVEGAEVRAFTSDFASSELFSRTYREGMSLVEETASYLDGAGRSESKLLPRNSSLAYAAESMRLTTRLMQVAAWLLVQKAVAEGEMSAADAAQNKYRLGGKEISRAKPVEGAEDLPEALKDMVARSHSIYDRIERLEQMLVNQTPVVAEQASPLAKQFAQVENFFQESLERRY
ncbi:MAG: regulator of CtrA degradation [Parvibaculaceae bacterium]|jgi:regulator of CtrA degradation